jgi:hypothetical protein
MLLWAGLVRMYSYDRRKTAAKMEVFDQWRDIVERHEKAEQREFKLLLHELVPYFKSNGLDLDVGKSFIGKEWHGSDGWRITGQFVVSERAENTVKSETPESVKGWVEEATGMYCHPRKQAPLPTGGFTWVCELGE